MDSEKVGAIPFSELQKMTEDEIIEKFGFANKKNGNLGNINDAINKIDISKLFINSNLDVNEIFKKHFGNIAGFSKKMEEIDNAMKIVSEQLERNPQEAKEILERELAKARKLEGELKRETEKYSNYDVKPIISALNNVKK